MDGEFKRGFDTARGLIVALLNRQIEVDRARTNSDSTYYTLLLNLRTRVSLLELTAATDLKDEDESA